MDRIKELLAVLDMEEESKWEWLYKYADENDLLGIEPWHNFCITWKMSDVVLIKCSLADLAFRLRDEAVEKHPFGWQPAKYKVGEKVWGGYHDYIRDHGSVWDEQAQPIHFIIAALIAKEQADVAGE